MARILIVDDEEDLVRVLDYNLKQAGHETLVALRGEQALEQAIRHKPDLVVLDLMLPDVPGTEVCRQIRSHPELRWTPVLMLTAKADEIDRVVGFELGADDYVVKPFSVRELVLRVGAVLRRQQIRSEEKPAQIAMGGLRLDTTAHQCFVDGAEVQLTALEFKLLLTFLNRLGRVQSREQLLADVWGITADIETRTVDTHVKRLREKLGSARDTIETVRGVGYRMRRPEEQAG
jgi:two-component system phosphate regulon response regulator PhoB